MNATSKGGGSRSHSSSSCGGGSRSSTKDARENESVKVSKKEDPTKVKDSSKDAPKQNKKYKKKRAGRTGSRSTKSDSMKRRKVGRVLETPKVRAGNENQHLRIF